MKTLTMRLAVCLPLVVLLGSVVASAQTASKPSPANTDSEQVLRDILAEVRQLRSEMRQATVYTHRAQILLDRIKVEQDRLDRLTDEVKEVRKSIDVLQGEIAKAQAELEEVTKLKNLGVKGEEDLKTVKGDLAVWQDNEKEFLEQEATITAEIEVSQAALTDLKKRMDELDREMSQPAADTDNRPAKKKP